MGRLMAIDYGKKRVGLAVSDPTQLIANALETVETKNLIPRLKEYFSKENVELVIVGYPMQMNNQPSEAVRYVNDFLHTFEKTFPDMPIYQMDERFTSRMAFQTMIDGGVKKMKRQDKGLVDRISATIILQSYMEMKSNLSNFSS